MSFHKRMQACQPRPKKDRSAFELHITAASVEARARMIPDAGEKIEVNGQMHQVETIRWDDAEPNIFYVRITPIL